METTTQDEVRDPAMNIPQEIDWRKVKNKLTAFALDNLLMAMKEKKTEDYIIASVTAYVATGLASAINAGLSPEPTEEEDSDNQNTPH